MVEQTNSKVPQIRFKGFEGEWVETPLGSITDSYSGGTPSVGNRSYYNGNIPFIRSGEINSTKTELKISKTGLKNSSAKLVRKGDVLYALYGATSGEVGVSQLNGAINQAILAILPKSGNSSEFLAIWLRCKKDWIVRTYLQGGQGNLSGNIVKSLAPAIPPHTEQAQIGGYFKELDGMIGLHQRKHGKLVTLKQAMLQKMFPQNGATTPEIRFKGFEEPWVEKELRVAGEFNPKADIPETFEYVDLESVVGTQMVSHRTERKATAPSRAQRVARPGDLFFQTVRPYQKNNHLFILPLDNYVFSTGYAQIRPFNDGSFLLALMQRDQFIKVVLDNCTGTSYPAINSSDLAKIPVELPTPKEQQKIGTYFRQLDTLISKHATQLEKLKQLKSACLEKMFV